MNKEKEINIPEILKDRPRVQKALREAVQKAIRFHKLMGQPIIVWKEGKVVEIPPEEIQLEETNGDSAARTHSFSKISDDSADH